MIWKVDPLAGDHVEELAYPELLDLQESSLGFEYVAVMPTSLYGYARVLQTGKAEPVYLESAPVSHDFFRVLGVSPVLGRDFTSSDERVGAPPVVVVSDRVWRNQLGADRGHRWTDDSSQRPRPYRDRRYGARCRVSARSGLVGSLIPHFQFDFGIPTLQRPSASLFIGVQALSGRTEANTQWVKKKTSRFSSPSTDF